MHKEKNHINDPTHEEMIGAKRDVTLVKTSSISEPLRKKMTIQNQSKTEETELKERSNRMDAKIFGKKKTNGGG